MSMKKWEYLKILGVPLRGCTSLKILTQARRRWFPVVGGHYKIWLAISYVQLDTSVRLYHSTQYYP